MCIIISLEFEERRPRFLDSAPSCSTLSRESLDRPSKTTEKKREGEKKTRSGAEVSIEIRIPSLTWTERFVMMARIRLASLRGDL